MPELPEVETVRRQLEGEVQGKTITCVEVRFAGKLNLSAEDFCAALTGKKVMDVRRRGKLLIIDLTNAISLLIHLKMSGRLLLVSAKTSPTKHTHAVLHLSDDRELHFEDTRKFGYLHVVPTADVAALTAKKYGPEPLEKTFSAKEFAQQIRISPKKKIKPHLLDQLVIAGVGNIYADESCYAARILPTRTVGSLSDKELESLYTALREILEASIERHGTSADMFVDLFGNAGNNLAALQVYSRENTACPRCSTMIVKTKLAGRGTHFCPGCQQ